MTYSVWNPATGRYDYFEAPGERQNALPQHLLHRNYDIGLAPEECAWPLPFGARPAGSGATPRGAIAIAKAGAMGDVVAAPQNWFVIGGLAVAAYFLARSL